MVERFHRQLEDSLKCESDNENWIDLLPLILIGIRTTIKEDLDISSAELIFDEALTLPADFIEPTNDKNVNMPEFIKVLRKKINKLRPIPTRTSKTESYLPTELSK
ncbi:hypothetical protein SSS_07784 [Sarcoptes scabiei]|uniref:Uncharacterized protein n=1 Tax=Sarcoptes scabiei TaxID=52283 RepID=A0A834VGW0_SARSC|nr:hypothetical protein SSS_07784 [Sarcoptes scabiei]